MSRDGRLAICPWGGHGIIFDPAFPRRRVVVESRMLHFPIFSQDGQWLATGNFQGRDARVWNTRTGKMENEFDLSEDSPGERHARVGFSPDGKWLVTSTTTEFRFWEVGSWRKAHSIHRHNAGKSIGNVVFSGDGKILAALVRLGEVRLVEPDTGREIATLPSAGTPHCFSADGSQLVTYAGRGGAFHVWALRRIRAQLAEFDLDWTQQSPYPAVPLEDPRPLSIRVVPAERPILSKEKDAEDFFERALLFAELRHLQLALEDFDRAEKLKPGIKPTKARDYFLRSNVDGHAGRWKKAADDWAAGVALTAKAAGAKLEKGPPKR